MTATKPKCPMMGKWTKHTWGDWRNGKFDGEQFRVCEICGEVKGRFNEALLPRTRDRKPRRRSADISRY